MPIGTHGIESPVLVHADQDWFYLVEEAQADVAMQLAERTVNSINPVRRYVSSKRLARLISSEIDMLVDDTEGGYNPQYSSVKEIATAMVKGE